MTDVSVKLQALMERYDSETERLYIAALNDALAIIKLRLTESEGMAQTKRLIQIKKLIEAEVGKIYKELPEVLQADMASFAEVQSTAMSKAISGAAGIGYSFAALPKETIKEIINLDKIILMGERAYTVSELLGNAQHNQVQRFKQIIAGGLAANDGYKAINERLTAAKILSEKEVSTVTHTAVSYARREADKYMFKEFEDVIIGWQSVSVLDSRTSLICAAKDGEKYMKPKYKKMSDIPDLPPRHFNCRSVIKPLIKNGAEDTTRAQNGDEKGQIDSKITFQKWFDTQSVVFKKKYLGAKRYALYKKEKLDLKDFINIKTGERLTIDEIKAPL